MPFVSGGKLVFEPGLILCDLIVFLWEVLRRYETLRPPEIGVQKNIRNLQPCFILGDPKVTWLPFRPRRWRSLKILIGVEPFDPEMAERT
jgi:hypothetical protein